MDAPDQILKQVLVDQAEDAPGTVDAPALLLTSDGTVLAANAAWHALCYQQGPSRSDSYRGKNITEMTTALLGVAELPQEHLQGFRSVRDGAIPKFSIDYTAVVGDSSVWYRLTFTKLPETNHVLLTHADVTKAKQAEKSFEQLLESPMDALMIVDKQGLVQMTNVRLEHLFGYTRDELVGTNMDRLLPKRFRGRHAQHQARFFDNSHARPMGTGLELLAQHKDGTEFSVEISLTPSQTLAGDVVIAAIRNVTERRVAQEQLAQLGQILETSLNEIYLFDAHTLRFTLVNQGARENLGYTLNELKVQTLTDIEPENDHGTFSRLVEPLRSGEQEKLQYKTVHRRKDGSLYPVEVHVQLYRGTPKAVFAAIATDISQRVHDEWALRDSEQRMALHVKRTPLAVVEWQLTDHVITAWNPAAENIFGYNADNVVGKHKIDVLLLANDTQLRTIFSGRGENPNGRTTNRNLTKDGNIIVCEWNYSLFIDEAGQVTGGAALAMDITARQRALEALLTSQDEERVRISRDLHDGVGQALTALSLALTRAQESSDAVPFDELRELVTTTTEDVRRISRHLRPVLLDELGLAAAVKYFSRELSERLNMKIDVLVHLPQRLPNSIETAIYRVVQEALTNVARHANATHASVVLTSRNAHLNLVVEDDGRGFDTSAHTVGAGVGLLGMRERVELLGGTLRLESTQGHGTTISVSLTTSNNHTR